MSPTLWALVKPRCGSRSSGEWGLVPRTDPGAESKYSPHLCLHVVVGDGLGLGCWLGC